MGGLIVGGELVVPGGHSTPLLSPVEPALDLVAVLVPVGVEAGWPSAAGSLAGTVVALVGPLRNDRGDLPVAQRRSVGLRRVRLVGGHRFWALAGPTGPAC